MRTPAERAAQGLPVDGVKGLTKKQQQQLMKEAQAPKVAPKPKAAAPKRAVAPKPTKAVDTFVPDGDLVEIWNRRMINPDQRQTKPIRISTPGMHLRWINLAATGRYQRARYDEGWVPVQKAELVDEREIYGVSYTVEGYVCRGEKQNEMLMKIPEAVWKKIRDRRYALVKKSQSEIAEATKRDAARHFGDRYNATRGEEIAETASQFKGEIKFGTEQVEPEPSDLEPAYEE